MAVATPVYERSIGRDTVIENNFDGQMTADEIHNASIKDIYAKIINPEYKLSDIQTEIEKSAHPSAPATQAQPQVRTQPAAQARPVMSAQSVVQPQAASYVAPRSEVNTGNPVYLVQGARADSDLFRADSEINRALFNQYNMVAPAQATQPVYAPEYVSGYVQPVQQTAVVEEESEDLRPTRTTIQYQTIDASGARISDNILNAYREGEIPRPQEEADAHSKLTFTKRDKIIMGVVLGLILSVFVLIIVNSAIISGLNADIALLDSQLEAAQQSLVQTVEQFEEATSRENVLQYGIENGLIK